MKFNFLHIIFCLVVIFFYHSNLPAQSCIGQKGRIKWWLYENIEGWDLYSLWPQWKYPLNPDYIETLNKLATPEQYNEYYGSVITGYIKAPETGPYVFNITGDDNALFFLSTDTLPANSVLRAELPGWCYNDEHNKYPEQTSDTIFLTAGQYYYFKVIHKEGAWGDYVWIYWKRPSGIFSPDWYVVPGEHLYESLCESSCPKAGTPCNDGNPNTIDDREDGHCHCIGTPQLLPSPCIGERGKIRALYYDNIPGYYITDLLNAPHYPNTPNRAEILTEFAKPYIWNAPVNHNHYGTRIRGYLRVPVSGNYRFNVVADNEIKLYLGTGDTTTSANLIAWNDGWNPPYEHYDEPSQTSAPIFLNAGQFYSIEILHKENEWDDHFMVFWKTPFAVDTSWKIVNGIYFYQYKCESACIPAGTPCNDNNANTFNDVYDNNCNCAGTPCADPACSNALGYVPYEPCDEMTERHSTYAPDSWLSCQPAPSPNPARGVGHWVLLNLGAIHSLADAAIWNYNTLNATGQGFNQVVVDYSLNGVNWTEVGVFNWPQAPGTPAYTGFDFSALQGVSARYVLFTALNNFDNSGCVGLSEIALNASTCPVAGTTCDDGNPVTQNDTYNEFCYCTGQIIPYNDCSVMHLVKNERPLATGNYSAIATITSAGLVKAGSNVVFVAGNSIILEGDFEVEFGAEFLATIQSCSSLQRAEGFFKRIFRKKKKQESSIPGLN